MFYHHIIIIITTTIRIVIVNIVILISFYGITIVSAISVLVYSLLCCLKRSSYKKFLTTKK